MRLSQFLTFTGLACSLTLLGTSFEAQALTVRQEAVDIDLTFTNTGEAVVINKVKFNVADGPMTAMIIENMALNPTKFGEMRYDLDGQEKFSKVIQTKVGPKKYDLEAVPKIPNGDAYLRFSYYGNMLSDGFVGKTQSDKGELIYFDWAPMQWASALNYRKVAINIPHQVDKSECKKELLFPKYLGYLPNEGVYNNSANGIIKTEKELNARNKIDISCVDAGKERYFLQLIIVQENVKAKEAQRIQFYMPSDFIDFSENTPIRTIKQPASINISHVDSQFVIHPDGVTNAFHSIQFDVLNGPIKDNQFSILRIPNSYDNIEINNPSIIKDDESSNIMVSLSYDKSFEHQAIWNITRPSLKTGTYHFSYNYDINSIRSGIMGEAEENSDEYYVFWADDTLGVITNEGTRSRKLVLPIEMPNAAVSDAEFKELLGQERGTEIKNQFQFKGKIRFGKECDYFSQIELLTTDIDGKHYLTLQFFSNSRLENNHDQLQIYIKKDLIPAIADMHLKPEGDESYNPDALIVPKNTHWFFLLAAIGGGVAGVSVRKKYKEKHQQKINEVTFKTAGDELWEAPELQVGGFSEAGKVAQNLHPIEVGLILGLEIQQIVGIMAQALGDQNKLIIRSIEPLKAYPASDVTLEPIEVKFVEIFNELGNIDETKLQDFIESVITDIQEKTWDCDLDATRKHYMNVIYKNPEEPDKDKLEFKLIEDKYFNDPTVSKPTSCDDNFWHNRYYWRHYNGYYTHRYHHNLGLSRNMNMGYQQFLQSSVCFNGCFTQPNLENVCHSACHSACHDACHSACHDACHSACHSACHHACHSACHSACVSGGAR